MTYVLIPGAGGVALYWHRVADELRQRGHDAIAVDLPADDDQASFTDYADAVVNAARDADDVTLVAQSLGGFTAPLVASRRPVKRMVFVNAMIPEIGETAGEWWSNTGQDEARRAKDEREGRDPNKEFDLATYFLHDLSDAEKDKVLATDRDQSSSVFSEPYPLKTWPKIPMDVVTSHDDRFFPAEFQQRISEDRLGITPDEVPGGHLVALSHPTELTEKILSYDSDS
jgi:pimeloyl-ACP methyl ester carboxylesterase